MREGKPIRGRLNDAESGFTLLELLIAMTLLSLLMATAYGGLHFGARAWEREQDHSVATDEIRLAQAFFRRELGLAYPRFLTPDATHGFVDFSGTPDSIEWLAPAANVLGAGAYARIRLRAIREGTLTRLILSERPELSFEDAAVPTAEALISNLQTVSFAYYGAQGLDDLPQWHDQWEEQSRLPLLIRIEAEFASPDVRVWPELIVSPRIEADVSCIYDVLTKFCRGR